MTTATDNVFHVKRTLTDFHKDPSGAVQNTAVLGTYASLPAAKVFAHTALFGEGYSREDLTTYIESDGKDALSYGDGIVVHAVAPSGETFDVAIDTKSNSAGLVSSEKEGFRIGGDLFHVLQTTTYYNVDRSGAKQRTEVEGTFRSREDAVKRAKEVLLDEDVQEDSFAEYDVRGANDQEGWDWGENAVVHVVGKSGENFLVEVVEGAKE